MTYNRTFRSLGRQLLRHGVMGLLLSATVACGGKKGRGSGEEATPQAGSAPPIGAGGAAPDEPEPTDLMDSQSEPAEPSDGEPAEVEPREPLTPMGIDADICPAGALIDLETGSCLVGEECPLGYAEIVLDEAEHRACEASPWLDQFGSEEDDMVVALERDLNGNTIAVGSTGGGLSGDDVGDFDLFVRVYDDAGKILWTQQFGSKANDLAADVALGPDGRIYVVGRSFELIESEDGDDVFVDVVNQNGFIYCLSDDGETLWHREIASDMPDAASSVFVDDEGRAHVAGVTSGMLSEAGTRGGYDGFFLVYDALGELLITRVFGGDLDDIVTDIARDGDGGVVLSGSTEGNAAREDDFDGADVFVIRYDREYVLDWARHFGTTGEDRGSALAIAGDGTIYVAGEVGGQLGDGAFGGRDFFLRSYTMEGELKWTRQYGTEGQDRVFDLEIGPNGLLYFAGDTMGSFALEKSGKMEGFFGVATKEGELVDIRDIGTAEDDSVRALAVDEDGAAYLGGSVGAALDEKEHLGLLDAFVAKIAFD